MLRKPSCAIATALLLLLAHGPLLAATAPPENPPPAVSGSPSLVIIHRAQALFQAGKAREAADLYTQVIDSESGTIDEHNLALLGRGQALYALKEYDKSLLDLQDILRSSKGTHTSKVGALVGTLGVYHVKDDWKSLVSTSTRLLSFADEKELAADGVSRGSVLGLRAEAYLNLKELDKGLTDCNEALSDPHLGGAQQAIVYLTRASIYLSQNKKSATAEDLQRILDSADAPEEIRTLSRKGLESLRQSPTTAPTTQRSRR